MRKFKNGIVMDGNRVSGYLDTTDFSNRFLSAQIQGDFKKSASFEGVETMQISVGDHIDLIPLKIMSEINKCGGYDMNFFMVRTDRSIPLHLHEDEAEVYFGGNASGTTEIVSDELTARVKMGPEVFSIVYPGWSHGLHLEKGSKGMVFFGVKFKIKKDAS